MPVTPTYPGVYVEEIPSGVRTITGVATSITAFIGRARRGPTNEAVVINNLGDFERKFGGLWQESTLGFAVRDFYLNGGGQALVVRLHRPQTPANPGAVPPVAASLDKAILKHGELNLVAASQGTWGNYLRLRVDHNVSAEVAKRFGFTTPSGQGDATKLFNLTIFDGATGVTEQFLNISVEGSPRRVDRVLVNESQLVRVHNPSVLPASRPADHPAPQAGQDLWGDNTPATNSKVASTDEGSDGQALSQEEFTGSGKEGLKQGLYALEDADLFNLLCIPPYTATNDVDADLIGKAAAYCEKRRAMLIVDPPSSWKTKDQARNGVINVGTNSKNAALFFPRLKQPNPLRDRQMEEFVPCGVVAGIFARTDVQRGVWKAPAGLEATLVGVPALTVPLTDAENGELNPRAINCLRTLPAVGRVVWGSRTLQGNDQLVSEWKYVPVRRLALYIEESLYRGLHWVVFEPNDEPLWAQIRLNVGAFMQNLFRQGAFQGASPREAYFVKCDKETTSQTDINLGIVNIHVGFAPLKPAEFVIIKLQQMAGQIAV
jgi:hypothetical protein